MKRDFGPLVMAFTDATAGMTQAEERGHLAAFALSVLSYQAYTTLTERGEEPTAARMRDLVVFNLGAVAAEAMNILDKGGVPPLPGRPT